MKSIRCKNCGEILTSTSRHDDRTCHCSNKSSIDGGDDYTRIGGIRLELIESVVSCKKNVKSLIILENSFLGKRRPCSFCNFIGGLLPIEVDRDIYLYCNKCQNKELYKNEEKNKKDQTKEKDRIK